jgi:hypothetical protein
VAAPRLGAWTFAGPTFAVLKTASLLPMYRSSPRNGVAMKSLRLVAILSVLANLVGAAALFLRNGK